jgi:thiamine biosynthesis lipoprotein
VRQRLLAFLLLFLLLCGCTPGTEEGEASFFAMDTYMNLKVCGKGAQDAADAARAEIVRLETLFSRTRADSDVARINTSGTAPVTVSEDTAAAIALSLTYAELTDGAFDIAIGPVMDAWGFGSGGENYRVPAPKVLEALLPLADSSLVALDGSTVMLGQTGMVLDLGGVGKGYAAQAAAELLRNRGIESALLYLGGNVVCVGSKPDGSAWSIAVQDPQDVSRGVGVLELRDLCAVTTGGYQRYFEADGKIYHHVIDPTTGYPSSSGILSATIVCADSAVADILSTSVYIMGETRAAQLWREQGNFEMLLLTEDGRAVVTPELAACLTLADDCDYVLESLK